jgi:hypothetical protein
MDQPCYKCGQPVEQGIPFCPHCSAPQIRVVVAELDPSPAVLADAGSPAQGADALPASQTVPMLALPMQWSRAIGPSALAALVASLLMALGLNPFVAMFTVGFLAVVFYRQRQPETAIKATAGAALGALGGLLWFAVSSVLEALVVVFLHKGPEIRDELLKRIQQAASQTNDPKVLEVFDRLKTPGGLELLMIFGLVFAFFAAIVLAGLGGVLGGAIFNRRGRT